MAKFEIPKSKAQVNKGQVTNITSLTLNPNLARQLGSDISQSGAVFEKLKADQRVIEDQNRFYEIINPLQKKIDQSLLDTSKFESLDLAEEEHEKAYEIDISNESKKLESETEFEDSIDKGVSPEDAQKNFEDSLNKRCKK